MRFDLRCLGSILFAIIVTIAAAGYIQAKANGYDASREFDLRLLPLIDVCATELPPRKKARYELLREQLISRDLERLTPAEAKKIRDDTEAVQ